MQNAVCVLLCAYGLSMHLLVFDSKWSGREVDDMIVELEEKGSYGLFGIWARPMCAAVIHHDGAESALGQTPDMWI